MALGMAQEMARLRALAQQQAADPKTQAAAVKARMQAEVEVVKAKLNYRVAAAELMSVTSCAPVQAHALAARPVARR